MNNSSLTPHRNFDFFLNLCILTSLERWCKNKFAEMFRSCSQSSILTLLMWAVIPRFAALVPSLLGAFAALRKSKIFLDLLCNTTLSRS